MMLSQDAEWSEPMAPDTGGFGEFGDLDLELDNDESDESDEDEDEEHDDEEEDDDRYDDEGYFFGELDDDD